jgi:cystathionine beta-synthase
MKYVNTVLDLIGDTPLVRLNRVTEGLAPLILAKVEYLNPGGSSKDRIASRIIDAAERDGLLKPGGTIVEPTSGNTGIGLALVAQQRGYRCVFVLPDKVGEDKRNVLTAYGAEIVVTPTAVAPDSPESYYSVSDRLAREIPGAFKPNQYSNPNGPLSHYETTGPEIWRDTEGKITHFVAGVGTGGTISGVGRYLKEVSGGAVTVIGADPEGSVYSGGSGLRRLRRRRDHCGIRRGVLRPHPPSRARGGAARRRLERARRRRGAQGCRVAHERRRHRGAIARRRARLPRQDLQ